jgi:hypothetical protein
MKDKSKTNVHSEQVALHNAKHLLADAAILKLEQEVRGWSIIVNNLKKQDAPLHAWRCAAGEVSRRVKEINRLRGGFH